MSRVSRLLPVLGVLLLACTGASSDAPAPDQPLDPSAAQGPAAAPVPVSRREPLLLSEREVVNYVQALEALARAGQRVGAEVMADTLGVVINEGLLAASPAAQRIILRQGFRDLEHFHQVAYSIASAMQAPEPGAAAALPLPEDPDERKALEEVRAAMGEFVTSQPAGNAALVAAYRDRIVRAQAGS